MLQTKAMITGLFIFSLGVACSAHADINGTWNGDMTAQDSQGRAGDYDPGFVLQLQVQGDVLMINDDQGDTELPPQLDIHGDELFLHGEKVGSISEYGLQVSMQDQVEGYAYVSQVTINADGGMTYQDQINKYDGSWAIFSASMAAGAPSDQTKHKKIDQVSSIDIVSTKLVVQV